MIICVIFGNIVRNNRFLSKSRELKAEHFIRFKTCISIIDLDRLRQENWANHCVNVRTRGARKMGVPKPILIAITQQSKHRKVTCQTPTRAFNQLLKQTIVQTTMDEELVILQRQYHPLTIHTSSAFILLSVKYLESDCYMIFFDERPFAQMILMRN